MVKNNRLSAIIMIGIAISFGSILIANAQGRTSIAENNSARTETKQKLNSRLRSQPNSSQSEAAPNLSNDVSDDPSHSDKVFSRLVGDRVAQAEESDARTTTEEIIKPAQPAVGDVENLNPSGNPLSFPTEPAEVKVDTQKPITLEQAVELSLKNNKEVEQARLEVEQSESALRQEKAALFPTLDLTSGLTYGNDLFLDSTTQQRIDDSTDDSVEQNVLAAEQQRTAQQEAALQQNPDGEPIPDLTPEEISQIENEARDGARDLAEENFGGTGSSTFTFNGGLGISYDIYNGGARGASIRSAEKQLRTTELDLERVTEETRLETSNSYYDLQNTDAQVEIQRAAVNDAKQTLKDAQLLEKAGLGTRFDVLRAEVELAQAEQRLTTAIANQNIARRQLAQTLSVSHSTDLATADAIEEAGVWDLELDRTIIQAFKNRAELEQFLLQREISNDQRTVALSQTRPGVSANADYNINDDLEDNFDASDSYSVGLNLQWRLFDGGAASAGARQAEKDGEIAETQFANQRNEIRFLVEQAFFQLKSNQNNIATATRSLELAEESLRLARLRFQAGVGTQTDVIEAQTQLTTERGNLLSSITEYNQSFAELNRQVSNTPDNGLQDLP